MWTINLYDPRLIAFYPELLSQKIRTNTFVAVYKKIKHIGVKSSFRMDDLGEARRQNVRTTATVVFAATAKLKLAEFHPFDLPKYDDDKRDLGQVEEGITKIERCTFEELPPRRRRR